MLKKCIFTYFQNIIGFSSSPEVHLSNNINPKDYKPKKCDINEF